MANDVLAELDRLWAASQGAGTRQIDHVPLRVFRHIRQGIADHSYLEPFSKHIAHCQACEETKKRTLEEEFDLLDHLAKTKEVTKAAKGGFYKRLIEWADGAKSLRVVAGEASAEIWTDDLSLRLKAFLDEGGRFQLIVGPVLATDHQGRHVLLDLWRHPNFELLVSNRRQPIHYWICDEGRKVYVEAEHRPGESSRRAYFIDDDAWLASFLLARFSFTMRSPGVQSYADGAPLGRIDHAELPRLLEHLRQLNESFDDLELPDLEKVVSAAGDIARLKAVTAADQAA